MYNENKIASKTKMVYIENHNGRFFWAENNARFNE